MKDLRRAKQETSKPTHPEILDEPVGRAFVVGFLLGFAAGKNGESEPDVDEIARRLETAEQDLVLAIQPRSGDDVAD